MCRFLKKDTIPLFDLSTSVSFAIVQGTDILTLSLRFPLWLQPSDLNFLFWTFAMINLVIWTFWYDNYALNFYMNLLLHELH